MFVSSLFLNLEEQTRQEAIKEEMENTEKSHLGAIHAWKIFPSLVVE